MLIDFSSEAGRFQLVQPFSSPHYGANTYTLIVGKNGTGKSRLLRSIVLSIFGHEMSEENIDRSDRAGLLDSVWHLDMRYRPEEVICVSTSPFDKFPLPRRSSTIPNYTYLGLRGLSSVNLSTSYLSKIANTLVDSVEHNREQASAIAGVLDYLGYEPVISMVWQLIPQRTIEDLFSSSDPNQTAFDSMRSGLPPYLNDASSQYRRMVDTPPEILRIALELAMRAPVGRRLRSFEMILGEDGLRLSDPSPVGMEEALLLIGAGLVRLKEAVLWKKGKHEPFQIANASSGEQAVVMSLLGIGSQIRNNSLICIDEPEVCLHPEWQEKYIHLLYSTFSHFSGCHFVIATHSPQIVAQLPDGDCHVMSMETGLATEASKYSHRSIDFQLAELFGTPGYRNEYLGRLALNLFSSVSRQRGFDTDAREKLVLLERMAHLLQEGDPVLELILTLQELRARYE
ncbi:putative ATPase [Paraburkholderia sp. GAS38]|jgi:predicted ATPase|uniref:AAA family ATPase n=1 Tax=Paraburkholderia sp. GAS38 TaxID=3035133 RepID=UPI003D218372